MPDTKIHPEDGAWKAKTTSNFEEAKDELESGFGAWDQEGKLLYVSHLFWLLKEVFWLLLITPLALICGGLSCVLALIVTWRRRDGGASGKLYKEVKAEVLIGLTQLMWLIFNFILMISEFIYSVPDKIPDYAEGMVDMMDNCEEDCDNDGTFQGLLWTARVGFILSFVLWLASCAYLFNEWVKPPKFVAQGYAFQTCLLEGGWIAFWVLKDFLWTFDKDGFIGAAIAWGAHFIILVIAMITNSAQTILWDGINADEMERITDVVTCGKTVDMIHVSYVLWSVGSLIWLIMENPAEEDLTLRWVAAIFCIVSVGFFLKGYGQAKRKAEALLLLYAQFQKLPAEDA
jgi:hypothetical protein